MSGVGVHKDVLLYTETWGVGGIEVGAVDEFAAFAHDDVSFTLFSVWKQSSHFDDRLRDLNVQSVFCFVGAEPPLAVRCLAGWRRFNKLLRKQHFDVVHVNTMNGAGLMYALISKRRGVGRVVAHSRNTQYGPGYRWAKEMAHRAGKAIAGSAADVRLACSEAAGRYLFDNREFSVLRRGIDPNRYSFDAHARETVRDELGIPQDAFVVGSIGRVSAAKNPLFQVEVFAELHRLRPDVRFLFVGDGDMRDARDGEAARAGIADAVVDVGAVSDAAPYYSAIDCLMMPSAYEGLPNVALEAQCSGLPVIMASSITDEARITDLAHPCDLEAGAAAWAQEIARLCDQPPRDRRVYAAQLEKSGFSVDAMMRKLRACYGMC